MEKTIKYKGHDLTLSFDVIEGKEEKGDWDHPTFYAPDEYVNIEVVDFDGDPELLKDINLENIL